MFDSGELAALGTALSWTASSLCFGLASRRVGGMAVNQFRILLAVPVLAVLHVIVTGALWPAALPGWRLWTLCLSGFVGLTLGDIAFFHALAAIGPRISSVLMATWPGMAMLLELSLQGQVPTLVEVGGLALSTVGVVMVLLRGKEGSAWNEQLTPRRRAVAVGGALIGALGQASGWVLARAAMAAGDDLPQVVAPISSAFVRMVAACAGIVVIAVLTRRGLGFTRVIADPRALASSCGGTLFGPIVGVWLSMVAAGFAGKSVAATVLIASTPIWMMPVSFFAYRARIGVLGVLGTLLTVGGAALLLAQSQ